MLVRLTLLLCWLLLALPVSAQMYAGTGSLRLQSAGTDATTTLESSRLNLRYTCLPQGFRVMIKTAALGLGAEDSETAIVNEVLMAPSNALMVMEWGGEDLPALCEGSPSLVNHPVELRITFNDESVTLPGRMNLNAEADQISLDLEATLSLGAFGLYVRKPYQAVFSDEVTLSLLNVSLLRR
ncbi:MAG: hypothetical protein D6722_03220 [Bacteroidetes bacterium]|nr:MAG: hypothetical protein D6722_03220 [Bacteroidota bacterium]